MNETVQSKAVTVSKSISVKYLFLGIWGCLMAGLAMGQAAQGKVQKCIVFTQQLTFEYTKDGTRSQFSVYLEPQSSSWLLTREDTFGGQPDDIDYWILTTDGKITIMGKDEHGKAVKLVKDNPLARKWAVRIAGNKTGKTSIVGQNAYGWPTLKCEEYALGKGLQTLFLAQVPYDCRPLLAYNFCLDIENPLPAFAQIEYPGYIPANYLVVKEGDVRLVSISPTEYEVRF